MFNGIASLIGIQPARFYQILIHVGAKPITGYFLKNVSIYLILDCHVSTPYFY